MVRILVIDDHEDTAAMLVRLFRRRTHQAEALKYPTAAVSWIVDYLPDLIVLNLMMPRMDGEEVLKLIRSTPGMKHLPVVIYSGDFDNARELSCRKHGVQDYIAKGTMGFDQLMNRISKFLPVA
jgi:CheY-like chemotaxis protein